MKKNIILFLSLLLSACITRKLGIEGTYRYNGAYGIAYEIELHSNEKFIYNWVNGLNKGTIIGSWEKEDNNIVINGGSRPEKKIDVHEDSLLDKDSVYIEVTNLDGNPLGLANIVLNDERIIITDMEGKVSIKKEQIRNIKINYQTFEIPKYQVKDFSSNHFRIKVSVESTPEIYFDNTKVKVKGSKLIMQGNLLTGGKTVTLKGKK
ncbi:MAG: hypothetical protein J7604_22750 [Sporocytophaga sp.]|uniref:hypothetical protein n=1 Tax=Sporocytophaga sp. TaxID=2231183 RepID=UPI001B02C2C9|nr:hypothetical protein [Sporocytophaga sp.]MBO9703052.1 hypothetical protein [Sporocytophaga sp.]